MSRTLWQVMHGLWWIILVFSAADGALAFHRRGFGWMAGFWWALTVWSLVMIYWTAKRMGDT